MAEQDSKPDGSAPSRSRLGSLESAPSRSRLGSCGDSASRAGRAAHFLAWGVLLAALATMVFGATVTSYSAGMAVPDWPTTFGYNPLFYPVSDWLAVWDVFLEHTHRLLGFLLGGLTIVLAIVLWRDALRRVDGLRGIRWLGLAAVAVYCLQEGLGGFRVLCDEIALANLHACTGPVFLAIATSLVIRTSAVERAGAPVADQPADGEVRRWSLAAVAIVYLQIVLGAQLRHLPVDAGTEWFGLWIWLHLIVAAGLLAVAIALAVRSRRNPAPRRGPRRISRWFLALVLAQLALGATTWITQFGWPGWFTDLAGAVDYTVVAEGRLQVWATTAHTVAGSLCLVTALAMGVGRRD